MSSPKKNVSYEFSVGLVDASTGAFKAAPTLATGDFKVSIDNGALTNLASLPTVSPAGSIIVKINLSQAEMNGDKIMVQCIDAAGSEWDDTLFFIDATTANVDDLALSSALTTAQNDLDIITDADGVILGDAGVDKIADEPLTAATHNVPTSLGRRIRTLGSTALFDGTASAGTADSITLAGGSSDPGVYVGAGISILEGTGAGQSRYIVSYDASSKIAEVARDWTVTPDNTSVFTISPDHQIDFIEMGVAQAGGNTSITLAAGAESGNNIIKGTTIRIMSGTGDGQVRLITAYNGTSKVATVAPAWEVNPDSTSSYATLNTGPANVIALSATQMNAIADHILRRAAAAARASGDGDAVTFRSLLGSVSKLTNKVGIVGTDLLIREEDDATTFGTQAATTDAAAEPITDLDTV